MRLIPIATVVALLASTVASAQPGPDREPHVPPPYAYQPQQPQQPTPEEQQLMARGYVTTGQTIGGGFAAIFLGLGIGQGIEGRWHERGWIFSLGESVSVIGMINGVGAMLGGAGQGGQALALASAISFGVFRVWDIADAFIAPAVRNARVRHLRERYGIRDYAKTIVPYIARPQSADGGMTAGISMRF